MVGLFVNVVPLRVRLRQAESLAALIARIQQQHISMLPHQYLSLEEIQRNAGVGQLFDTIFAFENYPTHPLSAPTEQRSLKVSVSQVRDATHYALSITAVPGRLRLRVRYRPELLSRDTVEAIPGRLESVLKELGRHPHRKVADVSILSPAEKRQLLAEWVDTKKTFGGLATLSHVVLRQAVLTPERVAVAAEDGTLTYEALADSFLRLSAWLRSQGVAAEGPVGVALERSVYLPVALLGTFHAGAIYTPIDPEYPDQRLAYLMKDSAPSWVPTSRTVRERVPQADRVLVLDSEVGSGVLHNTPLPDFPEVPPGQAAYLIYTSGSSGLPKGVVVSHASLMNTLQASAELLKLQPAERMAAMASWSFDISLVEVAAPWLVGATTRILAPTADCAPGVDVLFAVPSLMRQIVETLQSGGGQNSPRCLASGGEAVTSVTVEGDGSRCPARRSAGGHVRSDRSDDRLHRWSRVRSILAAGRATGRANGQLPDSCTGYSA